MKTYSLITKPYRIRLKRMMKHTLVNPLTNKEIEFKGGTEFWCAKAYSQDHSTYKSLFLFNHCFYTTFALGSKKVTDRWEIIDSDKNWRDDLNILRTDLHDLDLYCEGRIPKFVPKDETI